MTNDADTFVYQLAELGQAFSTRDRGLRVLADLQERMHKANAERVVVDFAGVRTVSYSFADGFFGKLAQRAADAHVDPPSAMNLSGGVRDQVLSCMAERGLQLHETSGALAA